jgi:hypothetical protein
MIFQKSLISDRVIRFEEVKRSVLKYWGVPAAWGPCLAGPVWLHAIFTKTIEKKTTSIFLINASSGKPWK